MSVTTREKAKLAVVPPVFETALHGRDDLVSSATAVVGIIGHAGAGKTELASAVSQMLGQTTVVSFGDAVLERARASNSRGNLDRKTLQRVGEAWVASDPEGLIRTVLAPTADFRGFIIVDGVHHEVVRQLLERVAGRTPVAFVHLKAPLQRVVASDGGHDRDIKRRVENVSSEPTERDVDRVLLAAADLVLDGSASVSHNAQTVSSFVRALTTKRGTGTRFVDGLEPDQRKYATVSVSEKFGWLLPSEVAQSIGVSLVEVNRLIEQRDLFKVAFHGVDLCPGFVLRDGAIDENVTFAWKSMAEELTEWEFLLWMMSYSDYYDDLRPVDATPEQLRVLVRDELDA